jgi:vancomycin resistance protein YoaR
VEAHSKAVKLIVLSAGLLAGAAAVTFAAYLKRPDGIIADGVSVAGMDWSGKPAATARAELEAWRKARLAETFTLRLPADEKGRRRSWQLTRFELGADVDVETTLSDAEAIGRGDSLLKRFLEWLSGSEKIEIAPRWKVDAGKSTRFLTKRVAPIARREVKNARFLALKTGFRIVPERPGLALNVKAAEDAVMERVKGDPAEPIELPIQATVPHVTAADLQSIEGEVSRFQTHYSETGNRRRNIETACARINGTVLMPGDLFSYNRIVGPRDEDAGFRLAPVIIRGRMQPGLGGGVCQTSSTLYNAVLLADLKIIRRSHHAFPVHYLPAGRDATVAYDSLDLQFQNNTDAPLAIGADGTGGRVLMRIFGKKVPGRVVRIERTNVSSFGQGTEIVKDHDLPIGKRRTLDRGHAGHRVTVWRVVLMNGRQVKREMLSRDHYNAFPRIVVVGTKPAAGNPAPSPVVPTSGPGTETLPASNGGAAPPHDSP